MAKTVLTRFGAVAQGALMASLAPIIAQDAKINVVPLLDGVTAKNFKDKLPGIKTGLADLTKGKLAQDADINDVAKMLDALSDVEVAEGADIDPASGLPMDEEALKAAMDVDPMEKIKELLAGKVEPDVIEAIGKLLNPAAAQDADDDDDKDKKDLVTKPAMDAAINAAVEKATKAERANAAAIRDAENAVRPYIGNLAIACDSAEAVYRRALTTLGVDHKGKHPDALPAILAAQTVPGSKPRRELVIAQDAATDADFEKRFPHAAKIGRA